MMFLVFIFNFDNVLVLVFFLFGLYFILKLKLVSCVVYFCLYVLSFVVDRYFRGLLFVSIINLFFSK